MLRYQLFLSIGVAFLAAWKAGLSHLDSIKAWSSSSPDAWWSPLVPAPSTVEALVTYLPAWAIVGLGAYALLSVLYRVATFGDCPEAADELSGQIAEAKEKLKAAGFSF